MNILDGQTLLVRYSFLVAFLIKNAHLPYPANIRFQKVSGLKATAEVRNVQHGGDNGSMYHLPSRITYDNIILENGRMQGNINFLTEISNMFSSFTFVPIDVLITAINPQGMAMSAWVAKDAYPVSWATSDLDANSNDVIIDTLELSYKTLRSVII